MNEVILQNFDQVRIDRLNVAAAGHVADQALTAIMFEQRGGGLVKDFQAAADGSFLVVRALDQGGAAQVAAAGPARRLENRVIRGLAIRLRTIPPPGQPLNDVPIVHGQVDDGRQGQSLGAQNVVQGPGLGQRARIAVQHEFFRALVPAKAVGDHGVDQVVGDELAGDDIGLGFLAGRRVQTDRLAQDIAGTDVNQTVVSAQKLSLGPFAASGWADQDQSHDLPHNHLVTLSPSCVWEARSAVSRWHGCGERETAERAFNTQPTRPNNSFILGNFGKFARGGGSPRWRPPRYNDRMERLNKYLAHAGLGSRRHCEKLILAGRVTVAGQPVRELGTRVGPEQQVCVDGQPLRAERPVYWLVHKPRGYLCTNHDPAGRPLAGDLVPHISQRVYTVGRLDEDSEGLLLLTNDGDLAHRLMHPRFGVAKTYLVQVAGLPTRDDLGQLLRGVWLSDGHVRARHVKRLKRQGESTWLRIVLSEGKNREIRRMLARLHHKVMRLRRIALGPVQLGKLAAGKSRRLSRQEVHELRDSAGREFQAEKTE